MSDNESRNLPAKRPDNRPAPYRMTSKDLTGNKEPIGPARAAIARPIPAKSAASSSDKSEAKRS